MLLPRDRKRFCKKEGKKEGAGIRPGSWVRRRPARLPATPPLLALCHLTSLSTLFPVTLPLTVLKIPDPPVISSPPGELDPALLSLGFLEAAWGGCSVPVVGVMAAPSHSHINE